LVYRDLLYRNKCDVIYFELNIFTEKNGFSTKLYGFSWRFIFNIVSMTYICYNHKNKTYKMCKK